MRFERFAIYRYLDNYVCLYSGLWQKNRRRGQGADGLSEQALRSCLGNRCEDRDKPDEGQALWWGFTGLPRTGDHRKPLGAEAKGHELFFSLGNFGMTYPEALYIPIWQQVRVGISERLSINSR